MKRKLLSIVLAAMIAGTPFSCAVQEPTDRLDERGNASGGRAEDLDRIEESLGASAEVQELVGMLEDAAARLRMRGLSVSDLARLSAAGPESVRDALGYSEEEAAALGRRLEATCGALHERYPDLEMLAAENPPAADSPVDRALFDDEYGIPTEPPEKGTVSCRWVPFVVALSACAQAAIAAGGNVGVYFVCAFQALCSYCQGGWVNDACN